MKNGNIAVKALLELKNDIMRKPNLNILRFDIEKMIDEKVFKYRNRHGGRNRNYNKEKPKVVTPGRPGWSFGEERRKRN